MNNNGTTRKEKKKSEKISIVCFTIRFIFPLTGLSIKRGRLVQGIEDCIGRSFLLFFKFKGLCLLTDVFNFLTQEPVKEFFRILVVELLDIEEA